MTFETERKFLVPVSAVIAGLGHSIITPKSSALRLLKRHDDRPWEVLGDRYHLQRGASVYPDEAHRLRFRSAVSSTGVLTESATIKIPTAEEDTRGELEFPLGERRGVTRLVYFASDRGEGNVLKARVTAGSIGNDGRPNGASAHVFVDLYTFPQVTDPVLKAMCVRQVTDHAMQRRLVDFDRDLTIGVHGAKGTKELLTYFDALMIVEVEGMPQAVRNFKPGDGWRELTGRPEWSAGSIALHGWPKVQIED